MNAHWRSVWDYAAKYPNYANLFNNGMASDCLLVTSIMITYCKEAFEAIVSFIDVGGGTGTVAMVIAYAFLNLHCRVFDLSHVVANLEGRNHMSCCMLGNMFEAIPNAYAILLKWLLHDCNDAECLEILRLCKEIIPSKVKGGKVIIIDMVLVDDREKGEYTGIQTQQYFDMLIMASAGGKERTENDRKLLFKNAGFTDYKITPLLGLRSLNRVFR